MVKSIGRGMGVCRRGIHYDGYSRPDLPCLEVIESRVQLCKDWISKNELEEDKSSYHYKQEVEKETGKYIANGEFILAAHESGYKVKPIEVLSINAIFYKQS